MLIEFFRCWNILLVFIGKLVITLVIAGISATIGVLFVSVGKTIGIDLLAATGKATTVIGIGYAAWSAVAAEFQAGKKILKFGEM